MISNFPFSEKFAETPSNTYIRTKYHWDYLDYPRLPHLISDDIHQDVHSDE